MCDPATAALALTAVGTGVQVMGQMQQGAAARAAGDYQAQVAQNNAVIAERNAVMAEQSGERAKAQQRLKTAQLAAAERAGFASRGVTVDTGAALQSGQDTAALGAYDLDMIGYDSAIEAYNYRVQASSNVAQAGLYTMQGRAGQQAGMMGAGATLLGGGASFADKWNRYYGEQK